MKALLIHIPKSGGTSVRQSPELRRKVRVPSRMDMLNAEYVRGLKAEMGEIGGPLPYGHARLRDIKLASRLGRRTFALVRNPFSRVVSRYAMAKKVWGLPALPLREERRQFRDFLMTREKDVNSPFNWHRAIRSWSPAVDYLTDNRGEVVADILRFECMAEDITAYFGLRWWQEHQNKSRFPALRPEVLFTRETQVWIERWFAVDFEYFGFTFYSPATRNFWAN